MVDGECDRMCASQDVLFENAEWCVRPDGIEHRRTGYFIDRSTLARRRDGTLWDWPLHLAEKSWCSPRPLREAFLAALDAFGIAADGSLTRSFAMGFGPRPNAVGASPDGFVALADVLDPPRPAARRQAPAPGPRAASRRDGFYLRPLAAGMGA